MLFSPFQPIPNATPYCVRTEALHSAELADGARNAVNMSFLWLSILKMFIANQFFVLQFDFKIEIKNREDYPRGFACPLNFCLPPVAWSGGGVFQKFGGFFLIFSFLAPKA
jgi:hypothetical protein